MVALYAVFAVACLPLALDAADLSSAVTYESLLLPPAPDRPINLPQKWADLRAQLMDIICRDKQPCPVRVNGALHAEMASRDYWESNPSEQFASFSINRAELERCGRDYSDGMRCVYDDNSQTISSVPLYNIQQVLQCGANLGQGRNELVKLNTPSRRKAIAFETECVTKANDEHLPPITRMVLTTEEKCVRGRIECFKSTISSRAVYFHVSRAANAPPIDALSFCLETQVKQNELYADYMGTIGIKYRVFPAETAEDRQLWTEVMSVMPGVYTTGGDQAVKEALRTQNTALVNQLPVSFGIKWQERLMHVKKLYFECRAIADNGDLCEGLHSLLYKFTWTVGDAGSLSSGKQSGLYYPYIQGMKRPIRSHINSIIIQELQQPQGDGMPASLNRDQPIWGSVQEFFPITPVRADHAARVGTVIAIDDEMRFEIRSMCDDYSKQIGPNFTPGVSYVCRVSKDGPKAYKVLQIAALWPENAIDQDEVCSTEHPQNSAFFYFGVSSGD